MGLVLKHVERTKAGTFQYRRRVPKAVAGAISKREFKKKLGDSEKEALKAWPRVHAEIEREIENAKRRITSSLASLPARGSLSGREAYAAALRLRADLIQSGADAASLAREADAIADSYPQDEYQPLGVSPVDHHAINLLRLGPDRHTPPAATLTDALKLYVKERIGPDTLDGRPAALTSRVIQAVVDTLGRDPVVSSLSREDARKVRDEMLDRVKVRGRGVGGKVSASTVSREISIIAAVINFAKVEFGLPDTFINPFNKLSVARVAKGHGVKASDKRDPLPAKVLTAVNQQVISCAGPDLALIWRILAGTGCRLAEVTGLIWSPM